MKLTTLLGFSAICLLFKYGIPCKWLEWVGYIRSIFIHAVSRTVQGFHDKKERQFEAFIPVQVVTSMFSE